MIKFKEIEKQAKTQVPVSDYLIETPKLDQIRLAVFDNNKTKQCYSADITFQFTGIVDGWKDTQITIQNDLYRMNNIAYKMPASFDFAKEWYEHAIARSRQFIKHTRSNLCTKLGYKFKGDGYKTIPFTWFNYDPTTHLGLLQVSFPIINSDDSIDFFANHVELELELKQKNSGNLRWVWAGLDNE